MAARPSMSPSMRRADNRGAATGWIQASAAFGLIAALVVIFAPARRSARRRSPPGAGAFPSWSRSCSWHFGLDAHQARREPGFRHAQGGGRSDQGAAARGLRPTEEPEARADRLLRHHVRAGRGLVLRLLLHAGVPRKVARRAGRDHEPDHDGHDHGQRAALRLLRLARRPGRPEAGDGRRHAAGAGRSISPAFTASPRPPTRRWSRRSSARRSSSIPTRRPARSSSTRSARPSSPAPATSPRAISPRPGISSTRAVADGATTVAIGIDALAGRRRQRPRRAGLKAAKAEVGKR